MSADDRRTHPSTDDLADLDAGLLQPAAAHDVRAHLAACATCAEESAAFLAVRAALAGEPDPGPVPPDVSARLDAALAAAAAERGLGVVTVGDGAEPVEEPLPRHRRLLPGLLVAAATVGVVGLGAWAALGGLAGGGNDDTTAGSADSAAELAVTDGPTVTTRSSDAAPTPERTAEETPADDAAGALEPPPEQAPEAAAPAPLSPEEEQQRLGDLTAAVVDGSGPPDREAPGCGEAFAEANGTALVAAVPTTYEGAAVVMLVVPGPGFGIHTGYVVPSCDALPGDEITTVEVAS